MFDDPVKISLKGPSAVEKEKGVACSAINTVWAPPDVMHGNLLESTVSFLFLHKHVLSEI